LCERELELDSLFAARDSSTSDPQQELSQLLNMFRQAVFLEGDAALATHQSMPQAPAEVP
jgi:hypothetical protein